MGEEEIAAVTAVLRPDRITTGPQVAAFEAEFAAAVGAPASLALNSCTAGLHTALATLGVGSRDEVIPTPMTFVATANFIEHVGARPVFVDVEPDTLNIDPPPSGARAAAEPSAFPIARVLARLTAAVVAGSERDALRASCADVSELVASSCDAAAVAGRAVARRPGVAAPRSASGPGVVARRPPGSRPRP